MADRRTVPALRLGAAALGALLCAAAFAAYRPAAEAAPAPGSATRGAVIFAAADCTGCHTDQDKAPPLSGGAALETAFGTFYAPNITQDRANGIGAWTEAEFKRAIREGRGKGGAFLYPVFPFPSFSGMSDQDIADLYAYMKTLPAVARPNKPHEIKGFYGFRPLMFFWRVLYFRPGPLQPVEGKSAEWNRGRYLAEAVAHCQECHTPRGKLGALDKKRPYGGNREGPERSPNITPHPKGPVSGWSEAEITELLTTGFTPEYDTIGAGMAKVVEGTGKLSPADRKAIAVYIKSLAPIEPAPRPADAAQPKS